LKNYIKRGELGKYYYINIYINAFLAILSGSLVISGILEENNFSYFWMFGVIITTLIAIDSTIKFNKNKKSNT
jgi:hypothetical protein